MADSGPTGRLFSYTRYDRLGRISEVGQIRDNASVNPITHAFTRNESGLTTWFNGLALNRGQVTKTVYDEPYAGFANNIDAQIVQQKNLRTRVSYTSFSDTMTDESYNQATFYSYDIHGNVDTLLQDFGQSSTRPNIMNMNGNRFKKIVYNYDLISGKVNSVHYQPGFSDQFIHRYTYDAENRLTQVQTSLDGYQWEREASYEYYRHGPLARTELGHTKVQGIDYAYTLQGWLKGINSTTGTSQHDIGEDGLTGGLQQYTAQDAIGLTLHYFGNEYTAIGQNVNPFAAVQGPLGSDHRPLYNGNISSMSNYIRRFEDASLAVGSTTPYLYNYRYDQLNRLTGQDAYTGLNSSSNTWTLTATDYLKERVSYDPNGNIVRYLRNSPFGSNVAMDSLTYTYYPGSNKLKHIRDIVPLTNWTPKYNMADDLNGQTDASNYFYDAIGNLTYDETERVHVMKWSVYGKLKEQTRTTGWGPRAQTQRYTYDAQGNRIGTRIMHDGKAIYTWYVRDAQGNILSVYSTTGTQSNMADMTLAQTERHIYGSNRLGVVTSTGVDIDRANAGPALLGTPERAVFGRGIRQYELSNHLGNVLSTISDKKIGVPYASNSSLIEYYKPDIITASEYYPFGMISRTHTRSSFAVHKFGFNGKENDNLLKGIGAQQDYGMRVYDPRLGKFLSVDRLQTQFPDLSPYHFAGNTPIQAIDLDGLEPTGFQQYWKSISDPYMTKWGYTVQDVYDYETEKVWTVMNYPNTNEYFYWQSYDENAQQLFKPLNTSLNKDGNNWTGRFREFRPKLFSDDRSLHYAAASMLGAPFVIIYGKATAYYLFSELLEEAAGVPIPDGPVDIYKYHLKREAEAKIKREMAGKLGRELEETSTRPSVAQAFEDAATGASSDVATRKRIVPTLPYDNPNTKGKKFVKFDSYDVENMTLIDRKWNVTGHEKTRQQLIRMSQALEQNPGYKGVIEVPTKKAYKDAFRALRKADVNNISVRIVEPN